MSDLPTKTISPQKLDKTKRGRTAPKTKRRRRSMILPEAYDERAMPALKLARSSRLARRIGRCLAAMIVIGLILMLVAPWQQSVRGSGNVIAYAPENRMQTIESPIKGRIESWGDDIYENARVAEGQVICEVRDLDESYADRLDSQVANAKSQVRNLDEVVSASRRNLENAETMVTTLESQVRTYQSVKADIIASAEASIDTAQAKLRSQKEKLAEVKATLKQAKADYERQKTLHEEKIAAELKFQQAEQKFVEASAKVQQAAAGVLESAAAVIEKETLRDAKSKKADADIQYATSLLNKAQADVSKSEGAIAKAESDLQKAKQDLVKLETSVSRQANRTIKAPFAGIVTQIMPNQGSAVLKEGDSICVIVPDTTDRTVQVWLDGNDAPLVSPGRHVRLQFEGWPAVQFAGWPSVAVGTFGGTVASVDATDNGKGKFRVLVRPDPTDNPWPDERYLKQGVRANGWVLLEQVPLWFEVWRNMNGFPPVVEETEGQDKIKKIKLPK